MKKLALMALVVGLGVAGSVSTAVAQPMGPPPSMGAAYGTAGCGLGSILFGSKPGIIQIFAATTNGFSGSQTFGITSGTSNCGAQTVQVVATKEFIETNREAFAKDVSRGSGETIDTIASLGGCSSSAAVGASLQKNFKSIFPNAQTSNVQVSSAALQSLKGDATLGCAKLI